ncbi:hypothetical protein SELMODRAFT_429131 [Selaginella moellendorffii]|uniref:Uncharacterized protein n=1 Tax=Selaginella moellendorffii TaxID=88036 RepID=D8T557_SELML|nr:hypothetical protein SELMODRAFT_429131 [Selaginella moellendorffii]
MVNKTQLMLGTAGCVIAIAGLALTRVCMVWIRVVCAAFLCLASAMPLVCWIGSVRSYSQAAHELVGFKKTDLKLLRLLKCMDSMAGRDVAIAALAISSLSVFLASYWGSVTAGVLRCMASCLFASRFGFDSPNESFDSNVAIR